MSQVVLRAHFPLLFAATLWTTAPRAQHLPPRADLPLQIATRTGVGMLVDVWLEGAAPVAADASETGVVFRKTLGPGTSSWMKRREGGVEEFVRFEAPPLRQELVYRIRLDGVSGLRLVARGLELLDSDGTPRLRMAPPFVFEEATRKASRASVLVEGCAVDVSPAPPWGRAVTAPGSAECVVRVTWSAQRYPLVVDPFWSTTGVMTSGREDFVAAPLPGGRALVAGGFVFQDNLFLETAEIFDGKTQTWALTSSLPGPRIYAAAAALPDGRVLLTGGQASGDSASIMSSTLLFDPATGQWEAQGALSRPRRFHTLSSRQDGTVVAIGCDAEIDPQDRAEQWSPSQGWTWFGAEVASRFQHRAILRENGSLLIAGGSTCSGCAALLDTQELSPDGQWSAGPTLAEPMVQGGRSSEGQPWVLGQSGALWSLAPGASAWDKGPSVGVTWFAAAAAEQPGEVLLISGAFGSPSPSGEVRRYWFKEASWKPAPGLWQPRTGARAVPLSEGHILVTGGYAGGQSLSSSELLWLKPSGEVCEESEECAGLWCVDGFCCDSPCAGVCEACSAAKGSPEDGKCAPVLAGTDPDQECDEQDFSLCGQDGSCDGQGACELRGAEEACSEAVCVGDPDGGESSEQGRCLVAHACLPVKQDCGLFRCLDAHCMASCESDEECVSKARCVAQSCQPRLALGEACQQGQECESQSCADGVCCNSSCNNPCEACREPGSVGICTPIFGSPRPPRSPCPEESDPCKTTQCDGLIAVACAALAGPTTACGVPTCSPQGLLLAGHCDGQGACLKGPAISCDPYRCRGRQCLENCSQDEDCSEGSRCDLATQRCVALALCDGDHTLRQSDGAVEDCSPFRCTPQGRCASPCAGSGDCVKGLRCNAAGFCEPPPAPDPPLTEEGCSCRAAPEARSRATSAWGVLAWLALGLGWRRRRRGVFGGIPWLPIAPPPGDVLPEVVVEVGEGRLLFVGGRGLDGLCSGEVLLFDPTTQGWSQGPSLPLSLCYHSAARVQGNRVLVAGGESANSILSETFLLDLEAGTAWQPGPALAKPRSKHRMLALEGGILVVGGSDSGGNPLKSTELGDGASPWKDAGALTQGRFWFGAVVTQDGSALVLGGQGEKNQDLSSVERYTPGVGWTASPSLGAARAFPAAAVLQDGRVLVAGGTHNGVLSTVEGWFPGEASWTLLPPLPQARGGAWMIPLPGQRALLAGGYNPGKPDEAFLWSGGAWFSAGVPPAISIVQAAAPVLGGALVAGRAPATGAPSQAALFRLLSASAPCAQAALCASSHCVDGVCCEQACDGPCLACAAATKGQGEDGICGPISAGTDPDEDCPAEAASTCQRTGLCDGKGACSLHPAQEPCSAKDCSGSLLQEGRCDGAGSCVLEVVEDCELRRCQPQGCTSSCHDEGDCLDGAWCQGEVCKKKYDLGEPCPSAEACLSGFCVDGVCCSAPCQGPCEACAEPDAPGTCRAISGQPRAPRPPCASAQALCEARVCDGMNRSICAGYVGDEVACGAPRCEAGVATAAGACDRAGGCRFPEATGCGAYACAGERCATGCEALEDCAPGHRCQTTTGRCVQGDRCEEDGHTVTRVDGARLDCAPFRCTPEGLCRDRCSSGADCALGARCGADGACVPPAAATGESCGCSAPGQRSGAGLLAGVLSLGWLASRRRALGLH